jgi:hypothetical protein
MTTVNYTGSLGRHAVRALVWHAKMTGWMKRKD